MAQAGTPIYEIQKILGHSSPLLTQRYAHLLPDNLKAGTMALDRALA